MVQKGMQSAYPFTFLWPSQTSHLISFSVSAGYFRHLISFLFSLVIPDISPYFFFRWLFQPFHCFFLWSFPPFQFFSVSAGLSKPSSMRIFILIHIPGRFVASLSYFTVLGCCSKLRFHKIFGLNHRNIVM